MDAIHRNALQLMQLTTAVGRAGANAATEVEVAKKSGMPLAPIMIYGDDVTHLLTEEGIAYLYDKMCLLQCPMIRIAQENSDALHRTIGRLRHLPTEGKRFATYHHQAKYDVH